MKRRTFITWVPAAVFASITPVFSTCSATEAREFNVIKPSTEMLYYYEIFSLAAPFFTAGSFVVSAISYFSDNNHTAAQSKLYQKLEELDNKISDLKSSVLNKLNDVVLKQTTAEALGIRDALEEYRRLGSIGILDNIITESAVTKNKIGAYLDDPATPLDYHHFFHSLWCVIVPLRVASLSLYEIPKKELNPLVKKELQGFIKREARGLEVARAIAQKRVSPVERTIVLIDEAGPVYGTEFRIYVDGKAHSTANFDPYSRPRTSPYQVFKKIDAKRQEIVLEKEAEVTKSLVECYSEAKKLLAELN